MFVFVLVGGWEYEDGEKGGMGEGMGGRDGGKGWGFLGSNLTERGFEG